MRQIWWENEQEKEEVDSKEKTKIGEREQSG